MINIQRFLIAAIKFQVANQAILNSRGSFLVLRTFLPKVRGFWSLDLAPVGRISRKRMKHHPVDTVEKQSSYLVESDL